MKTTYTFEINTAYDDGTNTALYVYHLCTHAVSYTAKSSWRLRAFKPILPSTLLTVVASSRTVTAGAPPAANTRTVTISTTGILTFGTNENLFVISVKIVASDVEENPYTLMSAEVPLCDGLSTAEISSVDCSDKFVPVTYIADTDSVTLLVAPSAAYITAKKLPMPSLVIAETDLVSREYSGQYVEVALKAVVSAVQAAGKIYEGMASQALNYLQNGASPMALELTMSLHDCKLGAAI